MRPGVYDLHSISPTDRPSSVSQKLLSRPDRMARMSLASLACRFHVTTATFPRFAAAHAVSLGSMKWRYGA